MQSSLFQKKQENSGCEKLGDGGRILVQCLTEGEGGSDFGLSYLNVQKFKGLRNSVLGLEEKYTNFQKCKFLTLIDISGNLFFFGLPF